MIVTLSTLSKLRRSAKGVNPVLVGCEMLKSISLPVALMMLIAFALSVLLIIDGLNPTPMILHLIRGTFEALSPVLAILLGGWMLLHLSVLGYRRGSLGRGQWATRSLDIMGLPEQGGQAPV